MRLNIDKLMIGFVMILAVCLYAPTILEDYKTNNTTNEKVAEVLAEAPVPARTTETVVLAAVTTQENIREAVICGCRQQRSSTCDEADTEVPDESGAYGHGR